MSAPRSTALLAVAVTTAALTTGCGSSEPANAEGRITSGLQKATTEVAALENTKTVCDATEKAVVDAFGAVETLIDAEEAGEKSADDVITGMTEEFKELHTTLSEQIKAAKAAELQTALKGLDTEVAKWAEDPTTLANLDEGEFETITGEIDKVCGKA